MACPSVWRKHKSHTVHSFEDVSLLLSRLEFSTVIVIRSLLLYVLQCFFYKHACICSSLSSSDSKFNFFIFDLYSQVKNATRREKRSKKKISSISLKLKKIERISNDVSKKLESYSHLPLDLLNMKSSKYTTVQKRFAVSLHLCSAKAYNYVRKYVTLPHPRSLRR